jgi:hypothetical protein
MARPMRGVAILLLAMLASACSADAATPAADAALPCLCVPGGMDIQVDFDTTDEQCPVTELGVTVIFPGGIARTNDIRCSDPAPVSQGARLIVPWPAGVEAGESGTVQVVMTGEGGIVANGIALVTAAPETCTVVAVHASCGGGAIDAGAPSADAAQSLAAR